MQGDVLFKVSKYAKQTLETCVVKVIMIERAFGTHKDVTCKGLRKLTLHLTQGRMKVSRSSLRLLPASACLEVPDPLTEFYPLGRLKQSMGILSAGGLDTMSENNLRLRGIALRITLLLFKLTVISLTLAIHIFTVVLCGWIEVHV